jgi:hypothetical protein
MSRDDGPVNRAPIELPDMAARLAVNPMTVAGLSGHQNFITALRTPDGSGGGVAKLRSL